jgi:leucyl aminopeptidase
MFMQIEYQPGECQEVVCDMLAYPVFEDETADLASLKSLPNATRDAIQSAISCGEFKPELHQTWRIGKPAGLKARNLLLIGAGIRAKFNPAKLRDITGTAIRNAKSCRAKTIAFFCRGENNQSLAARLAAEGALYAGYESDLYRTIDKDNREVESLYILLSGRGGQADIRDSIRKGEIVGEATNIARTLGNEPSNVLTPGQFAERAITLGAKVGLDAQVLEREEMEKLGMNTLLAVARGSEEPPKLIVLRTKGGKKRRARSPLFAIVGKGVTFDSGGISLKPSEKMDEMKSDMAGGAAVLGAMIALAQLNPRNNVIGLIPAVENLPSGKAIKPGDVVKSYLGKTVEIVNTDAEGRLILADAITYARTLGATQIIDIATLTGACVVALGYVNAGMLGTDQKMMDRLRKNCSITGEKLWQLPLDDEYRKAIRSEIADIKNVGNRTAGVITAAKFIQEFVENTPWVHLDIAGMDLEREGRPYSCKGAMGFGVRTLVYLLE